MLPSLTAKQVIITLKRHFARSGIPKCIVFNSGTQITSDEFRLFCGRWSISQYMSSPGHQKCNGKAEAYVKIFKRMLQRTSATHQDQWIAFLELRNTPRQDLNSSPAQILFGRSTRSVIPVRIPKCNNFNHARRHDRRTAVKHTHDKHARPLPLLQIHQRVLYQSSAKKGWERGVIVNKFNARSYVVKSHSGVCCRRNRVHLRVDKSNNFVCDDFDITHPIPDNSINADSTAPTPPSRQSRERRPPAWFRDYIT